MTGTLDGLRALVGNGYHHYNYWQIKESADMGCRLCRLIFSLTECDSWECEQMFLDDELSMVTDKNILIRAVTDDIFDNDGSLNIPRSEIDGWRFQDQFLRDSTNESLYGLQLNSLSVIIPMDSELSYGELLDGYILHLVTSEENPAAKYVPGRWQSEEFSPATIDTICDWLDECHEKHKTCPERCACELPRRVVDVGGEGEGEDSSPKLHISRPGEIGEYAALSYCWGGESQIVTTAATLSAHVHGLPPNLSNTITDAITVCRKLSVKYLWVDALCIVQDDEIDKAGQLSSMGTIYKQALFTIAAAGAAKASEGFLTRKVFDFTSTTVMAHLPFFVDGSLYGDVHIIDHNERDIRPEDSQPLFSRGWALQEMLLSPRVLVFDAHQLLFNCGEWRFKPVQPSYLSYRYYEYPDIPSTVFGVSEDVASLQNLEVRLTSKNEKDKASIWRSIVHEYSRRDLTFFADRLPALAGIANELSTLWGDRYLAGFWETSIIQHLAWKKDLGRGMERIATFGGVDRKERIGSPSWSWSNVPFGVDLGHVKYPSARMLSCQVEPVFAGTPFGQVKHAVLLLEAMIFNLRHPQNELPICPGKDHCQCYLDRSSGRWVPGERKRLPTGEVKLDFAASRAGLEGARLAFLGWNVLSSTRFEAIFLVVEEHSEGRYRRIGHATLKDSWQGVRNLLASRRPKEKIFIE